MQYILLLSGDIAMNNLALFKKNRINNLKMWKCRQNEANIT